MWNTVEQYFQYQKAIFGECPDKARMIKLAEQPALCKKIGDSVQIEDPQWLPLAKNCMYEACRAKFLSDPIARSFLIATGDTKLAEAGPNTTWGTGIRLNDPKACIPHEWNGSNELGKILEAIRNELNDFP